MARRQFSWFPSVNRHGLPQYIHILVWRANIELKKDERLNKKKFCVLLNHLKAYVENGFDFKDEPLEWHLQMVRDRQLRELDGEGEEDEVPQSDWDDTDTDEGKPDADWITPGHIVKDYTP